MESNLRRFSVYGKVTGSARPRVTRYGTYIPKAAREYRSLIRRAFTDQCGGRFAPIQTGPVEVRITVYRALPKSTPKRVDSEADTKKPDVDNIAKNVLDALNGLAWSDDSQITSLSVKKMPRTRCDERIIVEIAPLEIVEP